MSSAEENARRERTAVHSRPVQSWFEEAKLGIFIHWTAASVPGYAPVGAIEHDHWANAPYGEMYQNSVLIDGSPAAKHHLEHHPDTSYEAFAERFAADVEDWDPEPWADLFQRSGAHYVVFTTRIDDGFLLWPSAHPNPLKPGWQVKRDAVGALAEAVRARGMRFGLYYCGGVDWTFMDMPVHGYLDLMARRPQSRQYVDYVDAHWRELIARYEPSVMWNDFTIPDALDVEALFSHYREQVPDGVINDRYGVQPPTVQADFLTLEYCTDYSIAPPDRKWEACRGIGTSFGYNREESDDTYLSTTSLIHELCDIVARGGNLLLNVGPTSAGEIPLHQAERLLGIGAWLEVHGEALYGTGSWTLQAARSAEGTAVRFTASEDAVYAIVLSPEPYRPVTLPVTIGEGGQVVDVRDGRPLVHQSVHEGTRIELSDRFDHRPAVAMKLSPRHSVTAIENQP